MLRTLYKTINLRNYKTISNNLKVGLNYINTNKLFFSTNKSDQSIVDAKSEARNYLHQEDIKEQKQEIEEIDQQEILSRILKVNSTEKFEKMVVSNPKPVVLYCMSSWSQNCKDFLPKVLDKFVFNNKKWD